METQIQALHFEATEALKQFIEKKLGRLSRKYPDTISAIVTLKVVKPETSNNKEAQVVVRVPQREEYVAQKVADTFEEAVDNCMQALEPQLERLKGRC